MFLAYDKVPFHQYDMYQEYALMTPGPESFRLAEVIAGSGDEVVRDLWEKLFTLKAQHPDLVAIEYRLYAPRDASGELFDVYMVDEDGWYLGTIAGVKHEDVLAAGLRLMEEYHAMTPAEARVRRESGQDTPRR